MKRNYFIVGLIFLTFFVISLITNILGPIIPDIISSFNLSLTLAAFLPFSFFIAYGVMSIPAGILLEKYSEKPVMIGAFMVSLLGALFFSLFPSYIVALISLFLIGIGVAILQVAINPLLRVAGGEEHFAFNSVMAQLVFGGASFISPYIYSYLVINLKSDNVNDVIINILKKSIPNNLPWISLYYLFFIVILLMIITIAFSKFPTVVKKEDEKAGTWDTHKKLFKNKTVILFFLGIFAYVSTEQGVSNWISQFLKTYHGYDPQTVGASVVSSFWGLMTIGCILGLVLLKIIDSRKVLIIFSLAAMIFLGLAFFGSGEMALFAFPAVGFSASVMWSIIFSLALNSLDSHHGSFSGILCTGIIGGALMPVIIGWLGDLFGLRTGMLFLYIPLGYIFSIGFWAKPIIVNETIKIKKSKKKDNI
ncbi:MAG TPA: sugar MFS transporter [Bacteroidota bacterium]|nr:sugar MFS transporter [Bacteroidota bacterium]